MEINVFRQFPQFQQFVCWFEERDKFREKLLNNLEYADVLSGSFIAHLM